MSDFLYEVDGHLARLTMNRPEHLNCFSEEMIHLWTAALEDIRDRDDIYAVLLSGNGKAFCAGGDLKKLNEGFPTAEAGYDYMKSFREMVTTFLNMPKPTIAAVNGAAVGAGLSVALMYDMILASDKAKLGSAFINMALIPDLAAAYFERARANGVVRAECFFDPQAHTSRGIAIETVIRGYHRAVVEAREAGLSADLILCFLRDMSAQSALEPSRRPCPTRTCSSASGLTPTSATIRPRSLPRSSPWRVRPACT